MQSVSVRLDSFEGVKEMYKNESGTLNFFYGAPYQMILPFFSFFHNSQRTRLVLVIF